MSVQYSLTPNIAFILFIPQCYSTELNILMGSGRQSQRCVFYIKCASLLNMAIIWPFEAVWLVDIYSPADVERRISRSSGPQRGRWRRLAMWGDRDTSTDLDLVQGRFRTDVIRSRDHRRTKSEAACFTTQRCRSVHVYVQKHRRFYIAHHQARRARYRTNILFTSIIYSRSILVQFSGECLGD